MTIMEMMPSDESPKHTLMGDDRLVHSLLVAVLTPLVFEAYINRVGHPPQNQTTTSPASFHLFDSSALGIALPFIGTFLIIILGRILFYLVKKWRSRVVKKFEPKVVNDSNAVPPPSVQTVLSPNVDQPFPTAQVSITSQLPISNTSSSEAADHLIIERELSVIAPLKKWISEDDEALWIRVTSNLSQEQLQWLDFDLKIRFIRGSAFLENMKKRESYLKKRLVDTCAFREKYHLDTILNRSFPHVEQFRNECWRMKIYGNDDAGNPIVYVPLADHLYGQVRHSVYIGNILEYLAFHQEALLRAVRRRSVRKKDVVQPQYTAIFDLKGFGWRHFKDAYECGFFSDVADLWAVNYPETMRRIYVINAPFVITAIMKVISHFIEPDTLLKLRILGHAYMQKMETDNVPLSSLPREIGGGMDGAWILPPENPKLEFD